jgi:hypothetical protein
MAVRKKSNGNGAGKAVYAVHSDERPVGSTIDMTEEEKARLSAIDQELANMKLQLGELAYAREEVGRRYDEAVVKMRDAQRRLQELVATIGSSHGIDPGDRSKGMWNLNLAEGVLQRTA